MAESLWTTAWQVETNFIGGDGVDLWALATAPYTTRELAEKRYALLLWRQAQRAAMYKLPPMVFPHRTVHRSVHASIVLDAVDFGWLGWISPTGGDTEENRNRLLDIDIILGPWDGVGCWNGCHVPDGIANSWLARLGSKYTSCFEKCLDVPL